MHKEVKSYLQIGWGHASSASEVNVLPITLWLSSDSNLNFSF